MYVSLPRFRCPDGTFYDLQQNACLPQDEVPCDCIRLTELVYPKTSISTYSSYPIIHPSEFDADSLEDNKYPIEVSYEDDEDESIDDCGPGHAISTKHTTPSTLSVARGRSAVTVTSSTSTTSITQSPTTTPPRPAARALVLNTGTPAPETPVQTVAVSTQTTPSTPTNETTPQTTSPAATAAPTTASTEAVTESATSTTPPTKSRAPAAAPTTQTTETATKLRTLVSPTQMTTDLTKTNTTTSTTAAPTPQPDESDADTTPASEESHETLILDDAIDLGFASGGISKEKSKGLNIV